MSQDSARLDRTAAAIVAARMAHVPLAPLAADERPATPEEGYAIQRRAHARLAVAGHGMVIGYKIGCTTAVMQRMLDIPTPCSGGILAEGVHHGAARLSSDRYLRPGIECEIAVRLGEDFGRRAAPYDREAVAGRIAHCMVAIEIVDDRYSDYRAMGVATLIADDFFHAGCILGDPMEQWRDLDLEACCGRTLVNGEERGRGRGADIMGHPFNAVAWLANALIARGQSLRAGQIVLCGSVVETQWLAPGDCAVVDIDTLGTLQATLE
jgi:2-oxo-3-hexenedioate decarboxylase/2-keto-4-pentenoate hydratase